jgi:hypothetical protein
MVHMNPIKLYYTFKPILPRWLQIHLRRIRIDRIKNSYGREWLINQDSCCPPNGWSGWPENKKFALVLTHDVESAAGVNKCKELARIESDFGFCSSFNFVPWRYQLPNELRNHLADRGFEIGVHDLKHDGKLYSSQDNFNRCAVHINSYLSEWGALGFRSGAMHRNLDWIQNLNIKYDSSTFDIDPFEPQSDGVGTIFPYWYQGNRKGYVELPYTLPQDFTLYVLMKERTIDLWVKKLDWIVSKGGMVLSVTHPDYMCFNGNTVGMDEYHASLYIEFLEYISKKYKGEFWNPLPKSLAEYWENNHIN